jgi:hypothetical protein
MSASEKFTDFEKRILFETGTLARCSDRDGNINWSAVEEDLRS